LAARTDLAWGIAAYAVVQLSLTVFIAGWSPRAPGRDSPHELLAMLKQRLDELPERPLTIVMIGTSRVEHGFDAQALEEQLAKQLPCRVVAFNMGIPQSGPVNTLILTKRMRAQGIRPDLFLVEVAPTLLAKQCRESWEAHSIRGDCLAYAELVSLETYGCSVARLRDQWLRSSLTPCYYQRDHVYMLLNSHLIPHPTRWGLFDRNDALAAPNITRDMLLAGTREGHYPAVQNFQLDDGLGRALKDLGKLCRGDGIPTALVWMPEGSVFRGWYPPRVRAEIRDFIDQTCREADMPFIDAQEWVADEDFSDQHHLRPSGAKVFTDRLGRMLLEDTPSSPRLIPSSKIGAGPTASR
jgi:hypothetical protein